MLPCRMTATVVPISKRGSVTLPPAMRKRLSLMSENSMVILEERGDEIVLRPAAVVAVRDLPEALLHRWVQEDEAGMQAFKALTK
jgi:AbrB family looped-hinge helix DNA binding protein